MEDRSTLARLMVKNLSSSFLSPPPLAMRLRRLRQSQSKRVRGREDGTERLALGAISRRVERKTHAPSPAAQTRKVGLEGGPAADRRPPLRPAELAHSPRVCGGEDGVPGA